MSVITTYVLRKEGIKGMMERDGWVHSGYLWSPKRKENVYFDYLFDAKNDMTLYDRMARSFGNPSVAEAMLTWPVHFHGEDEMVWEINYGFNDNPAFALAIKYPDEVFHLCEYMEGIGSEKFFFCGIRHDEERDADIYADSDQNGKRVKSIFFVTPIGIKADEDDVIITTQAVFYPENNEVNDPGLFTEDEINPVKVLIRGRKEDICCYEGDVYLFMRDDSKFSFSCEEKDISGMEEWRLFRAIEEGRNYPVIEV